jgi:hypothetical protein
MLGLRLTGEQEDDAGGWNERPAMAPCDHMTSVSTDWDGYLMGRTAGGPLLTVKPSDQHPGRLFDEAAEVGKQR